MTVITDVYNFYKNDNVMHFLYIVQKGENISRQITDARELIFVSVYGYKRDV